MTAFYLPHLSSVCILALVLQFFVTNDIPFTSANTDSKQKLQKIFYFTHFVRKQLFCYQLPTLHYPAVSFFVAHSFKS